MTCSHCYPALRPMNTAPRDGTAFLASFPGSTYVARNDVKVLHYCGWGSGVWQSESGAKYSLDEPIGWRPLPPEEKGYWSYDENGKKWVSE